MKNCIMNDICETVTDYVANGSFATLRENVKYLNTPDFARLIRLVDYHNSYRKETAVYISKESYEFLSKSKLFGGEIIISNVGNIGESFLCPNLQIPMSLAPNCIMIKTNQLDKYIYYYLNSDTGKAKLMSLVSGSAIQKFNKTDFKKMKICIHEPSEQQHIVNILGTIDDKIENNLQIMIKIKTYMQLIFLQYEKSTTNNDDTKIGDYLTFIKGKKPLERLTNQLNYLNIEGMETNIFEIKCADNMIVAEENDLLMVMDGASSGNVYSGYNGIVGSTMAKLLINPKEYTPIIEQKLIQMKTKIRELNTGSAIPHANKEYINSLSIKLSNNQKQEILVQQLSLLKNEIFSLRKQNIQLNHIKQMYLKKFFR